jgi:hypothetical protein
MAQDNPAFPLDPLAMLQEVPIEYIKRSDDQYRREEQKDPW